MSEVKYSDEEKDAIMAQEGMSPEKEKLLLADAAHLDKLKGGTSHTEEVKEIISMAKVLSYTDTLEKLHKKDEEIIKYLRQTKDLPDNLKLEKKGIDDLIAELEDMDDNPPIKISENIMAQRQNKRTNLRNQIREHYHLDPIESVELTDDDIEILDASGNLQDFLAKHPHTGLRDRCESHLRQQAVIKQSQAKMQVFFNGFQAARDRKSPKKYITSSDGVQSYSPEFKVYIQDLVSLRKQTEAKIKGTKGYLQDKGEKTSPELEKLESMKVDLDSKIDRGYWPKKETK